MSTTYMRYPRVAGSFYPKNPEELAALLERCYAGAGEALAPPGRRRAAGAVVPHAGLVYSGGVAARVYARLEVPGTVIVLCPNHTGMGAPLSLWPGGIWMCPAGELEVDERLCKTLLAECPELENDTLAHSNEHAIEVHMPFLLRERPGVKIAPIVVGTGDAERLTRFGDGLARAIRKDGREVLIVSSSDMNHYEDQKTTLRKDEIAIERVLKIDPVGLVSVCRQRDISMCGVSPTAAMLKACAALGAKDAVLVDHRTSGDAFGDYARVVGYAGVIIS